MFHKEIYEQTEPGSVFLEYLEAQIFENFSARHKPWWHLVDLMCVPICLKETLDTSLIMVYEHLCSKWVIKCCLT